MTAVIYSRYSSDNQREESIEGQIRECTAYAKKNGITVIKHYIDRAFSAKTDNRPEFQQMIKDSSKKLFDVVLVWKFDRFARNRFDSAKLQDDPEKERRPSDFRHGTHCRGLTGHLGGNAAGRHGRILFRRAVRKSDSWSDRERSEREVYRRYGNHRL